MWHEGILVDLSQTGPCTVGQFKSGSQHDCGSPISHSKKFLPVSFLSPLAFDLLGKPGHLTARMFHVGRRDCFLMAWFNFFLHLPVFCQLGSKSGGLLSDFLNVSMKCFEGEGILWLALRSLRLLLTFALVTGLPGCEEHKDPINP
jgi:hypothetical protein